MGAATYTKDPQAVLDYVFDWSQWLQAGESIVTCQFNVSNTNVNGLTVSSTSNTVTAATIWLGGGLLGRSYNVQNVITTDMGRTNAKSINIKVASR